MKSQEHTITFLKQFNGSTKITKSKSYQNTVRQFKTIQSVISLKKNSLLQESSVLPVKIASDSFKSIVYTVDLPKYKTLKELIQSEDKPLTQEFIKKCIHSLIGVCKLLSVITNHFVPINPEKILIVGDNIILSLFAFDEEDAEYDPEQAGISLDKSHIWSIAMLIDRLYRGQLRSGHFTEIPDLTNPNINIFLNQVFSKEKYIPLEEIQAYLNPVKSLLCEVHRQPCIKVNLKDKKFLCAKCMDYTFYNVELQQNKCRNKMDEVILQYKAIDQKFDALIKLTKGEDLVSQQTLEPLVQDSIQQFKEQFGAFIDSLQIQNVNPIYQQTQLDKLSQTVEAHKDQLVTKYQSKIKKDIMAAFKTLVQK